MHRIDTDGHVGNLFTDGNPGLGQAATIVDDNWLNDTVQEELCNVVEDAGITLVKGTNTQLLAAIDSKVDGSSLSNILTMQTETPVFWDGGVLTFAEDLEIVFQANEAGARRINKFAAGTLTLADGEIVVARLDSDAASPVTLALQATYGSLAIGEYSIIAESALTTTTLTSQTILFRRRDITPAFHYGVAQKVLEIPKFSHRIYDTSKFVLGDNKNLLREDNAFFGQSIINGNMDVSQRGNFTTAIAAAAGFGNDAFFLDRWRATLNPLSEADGSFQTITNASITNYGELTRSQKMILNTTGGGFSSTGLLSTNVEDFAKFAGKTVTATFFMRSNATNNVRARLLANAETAIELDTNSGDETFRQYHISIDVGASPAEMTFSLGIGTSVFGNVTIGAGEYIEFTGVRLYVGTDHLDPLMRSFDDELELCQRYFQGPSDGENVFNAGYSIHNLGGQVLATAINDTSGFLRADGVIADTGSDGTVYFPMSKPMAVDTATNTNLAMFDTGSPIEGGTLGSGGKCFTRNTAGSASVNIAVTGGFNGVQKVRFSQTTQISDGEAGGAIFLQTEII